MNPSTILEQLAEDFASAITKISSKAEHDRWQAGIGPFEEENQIEMLREEIDGGTSYSIKTEVPYLDGGQRADVFIERVYGLATLCERMQLTTTETGGHSDECGARSAGSRLSGL